MIIYVVKQGDTIYSISQMYGVPMEKIIADNELTQPNNLVVGQTIVILTDKIEHVVQRGQTLYTIAESYGVSLDSMIAANPQLERPYRIYPGDIVYVPVMRNSYGSMEVNGYVFPNIKEDVLRKTLPHLTYISIFSYQVRPDGSLNTINDQPVIDKARAQNVAPLMVITNIKEGASFDSDITKELFASEQAQQNLINNILQILSAKNYYGLNIDFEYVYPEDRENYNMFLAKITAELNRQGYIVTTSIAPKIGPNQEGLLYTAHDYPFHGKTADRVILMTYEWGYLFGPARAVSPINEVERVLNYAVSVMPSEKILMGMPNYGYDWTLPFVQGSSAQQLTNVGAVDLAREVGSFIEYDMKSQAPNYNYWKGADEHKVWFEDARSVEAKLKLVDKYNLSGVSYWNLNSYFPQMWLVQDSMYNVIKVI